MAIILYCQNGHDLSVYESSIRMARPTAASIHAMVRHAEWERRQARQSFCNECGAPTLGACGHCKSEIKSGERPSYCGQCGKPFPWTEAALSAARKFTDEFEELSQEDKMTLKGTFESLIVNAPDTPLAVSRYTRILKKVGSKAGEALTKIIVDVASETAVKLIKG